MPLRSTSGSVRSEGTFGRLRYHLGGCHPSKTAHQTLSLSPFQGIRLEPRLCKGGISLAPPPDPEIEVLRLPPILRMHNQGSTSGCSKASRGLSVLRRVPSVFARHTTSPGVSPRQWPSRYTIHAGRNLPDKEFRYLRTVIVTAAVYRGFGLGLAPLPLTFRHWAGVRLYTSPHGLCIALCFW